MNIAQKYSIMNKLNNTVEYETDLASSEVQCPVLFSDNTKKHCTSLEGSEDEEKLKLFLKSLALKIIKNNYEKYRENRFDIH